MNVKIDTKEKFTVITPNEASLTANMTVELKEKLLSRQNEQPPHLILHFGEVEEMDTLVAEDILQVQKSFYENQFSFVLCCMNKEVEKVFSSLGDIEDMNTTPSESEAWDIVQMEEIERELLKDFED